MQKGDKVIIKECHASPALVGKDATVYTDAGMPMGSKYPILVTVEGREGLYGFREDELELKKEGSSG